MFFFSKKMKSDFNIMDNFMWLREINRVNKNQFFFLTTKLSIRVNRTWNLTFLKHLIVLFLCQAIFFSWNITFLFFFFKKKTKKKRSYLKNESSSRWYSKFLPRSMSVTRCYSNSKRIELLNYKALSTRIRFYYEKLTFYRNKPITLRSN